MNQQSTLTSTLVNGEFIDSVSVKDRGFQFGDGLFETIAVSNNKPLLWDQHIQRLKKGCERLKLPLPDESQLYDEVLSLFEEREFYKREPQGKEFQGIDKGIDKCVLKIIYTRGEGGRGYQLAKNTQPTRVLQCHAWPVYPDANMVNGIQIRLCESRLGHNPLLAGLKHLNRLEQVIARAEWQNYDDIFEGIMLDIEGHVIEGTLSNVFFVQDNELITPDLEKCGINGVIRDLILTTQYDLNITHSVRNVDLQEFSCADEIFITNSLIGVWPVSQFEDISYPIGPVTKHISQTIEKILQ